MTKDWTQIDVVAMHVNAAADMVAQRQREAFMRVVDMNVGTHGIRSLESPLEALFVLWYGAELRSEPEAYSDDFTLIAQVGVTCDGVNFRLDFVLQPSDYIVRRLQEPIAAGLSAPKIAIELDGHAFHEKTREQVSYRNQRDRLLQQDGWKVFHFSWSEFTSKPRQCVEEVLTFASNEYAALDEQYWSRVWAAEAKSSGPHS